MCHPCAIRVPSACHPCARVLEMLAAKDIATDIAKAFAMSSATVVNKER